MKLLHAILRNAVLTMYRLHRINVFEYARAYHPRVHRFGQQTIPKPTAFSCEHPRSSGMADMEAILRDGYLPRREMFAADLEKSMTNTCVEPCPNNVTLLSNFRLSDISTRSVTVDFGNRSVGIWS